MDKPMFLLRKFRGLSKENQKDWVKVIESVKNSEKEKAICSYLQWNLKKEVLVDLPCYSSPAVQDDFRKKILESCEKWKSSDENTEIVKILVPLFDRQMLQMKMEELQFIGQPVMGIQKLSKSWSL